MKKISFIIWLLVIATSQLYSQNYISGIVSLYGDNTASGTTIVAPGAFLVFNKNKLYVQSGFANRGDSAAISADSGTLVLSGDGSQGITGRFRISALQVSNNSGTGISNIVSPTMVTILDSVSFGNVNNGVFNAGDSLLTLRSNAQKTARIADLTNKRANSGNAVTGSVVAERYLRSRRAWHLLCPPTTADSSNDQTIQAAWQEGARAPHGQIVNPHPGYGTVITRPGSDPASATGYDDGVYGSSSYSLHTYYSNGYYSQPVNTDLTHFSAHAAYFLFIRGDRSVGPATQTSTYQTASTITTLRSKGALHNGDVVNTITNASGGYAGIANPYACTVDFSTLALSGIVNGFYTWDPSINTLGGWVYIDGTDNYNATPVTSGGVGVYTNPATNSLIQSGQAILVRTVGSTGTVTFKEKDKNITNRVDVFRQEPLPAIIISLYTKDSSHTFADGATSVFDASFSRSALPDEDINKPGNVNENLSFYSDTNYLMKEKWPMPAAGDTLPLRLWKTSVKKYSFEISEKYLDGAPQAYLVDHYLQTSAAVTAGTTAIYDFDITSDEASKAIDRFAIVFGSRVLPVTLLQVKASWVSTGINVEWTVQNESGVADYEVERSADGSTFTKLGTVAVQSGNAASKTYRFADGQPAGTDNYYRVKSIDANGSYTYSSVVQVAAPEGVARVSVYPNPVTNGTIRVWFKNEAGGMYLLGLYGADGKKILGKTVSHPGGNAAYQLPAYPLAQGLYHLVISSDDNGIKKIDVPVIIK